MISPMYLSGHCSLLLTTSTPFYYFVPTFIIALLRYSPYKLEKNAQRFSQCSIVKLFIALFRLSKEDEANDETTYAPRGGTRDFK